MADKGPDDVRAEYPEPVGVRASDLEREGAAAVLRDAAAEGRVTFEELADRIELAMSARTRKELDRLTKDLPASTAEHDDTDLAAPVATASVFGDIRRSGAWRIPALSRYRTVFGDIVLGLREAQVTARKVTIDANSVFGDIELLVPEGVAVEIRSRRFMGNLRQEADAATPGAPRVILTGRTVFGNVRVRRRRLHERLLRMLTPFRFDPP